MSDHPERTRTAFILFVLLLSLTPSLPAQDSAALYRQGVDLQRAGDLPGAVDAYRKCLAADPGNIAAHSNLGAALAGLGRYDEAIPEYDKAIASAPEQVKTVLQRNLALAYFKSGRLQEAVPILTALYHASPANHETALLAADGLLQLGEPAKALALLEPLAPEAGSDKALAYALGIAYLKTGKTADAQRTLDPLLKDDRSPEGQYALGMAMFSAGDYPSALKALRRAIELNPKLPHVESFYGQALLLTGDPDEALEAFGKQLAADPNDYDANYESAQILQRRGADAEALPLLRRAVMLRPKSYGARLALADALTATKQTSEARAQLESLVKESPELGAAHERLAKLYASAGLKTEATREQTLAAKYAPKPEATGNGPAIGGPAPKFVLAQSEGGGSTAIPSPGKPTVLVFGSYTCPNFRKASPVLNEMAEKLGARATFLQVYIREAHAEGQWQSTINEREKVELEPASTMEQKHDYAMMCQRKLHLRFPAVVDGLDNAAEKAYAAWPSRVFVIDAVGRVRYSSGLLEEEFDRAAFEKAVLSAIPRSH
jgi:tetratricopeptide (TPR) repeat protein